MSDKEQEAVTLDDLQEVVAKTVADKLMEYDANKEAEAKAAAEAEAKEKEREEEIKARLLDELEEEGKLTPARKGGFNINSKYRVGTPDDEYKRAVGLAAWKYIKTGDMKPWRGLGMETADAGGYEDDIFDPGQFGDAAIKAAFAEGSAGTGGILVPNDFFPDIVEKRDQVSWARQAGVRVLNTSRDVMDIPAENASESVFAITNEASAYDTDAGPSFSNVQVNIYKFTRTHRVSEEMEADDAAGLPQFISSSLGRAWGLTENQYIAIGTGSSQPQGVMVGADTDDILSLDTGASMSTAEIPELYYKLTFPYRVDDSAIWLMNESTEATLFGRVSANSLEIGDPIVTRSRDAADGGVARLMGKRVFNDANISALGTGGNFVALIGNMNYYALVQNQGLLVSRNPYLYEATGQIGIFARARWGGAVLQDEAFKVARATT